MANAWAAGAAVSGLHGEIPRDDAHAGALPFVPYGVWKDAVFSAVILLAIAGCAFYFGPFGPSGQPDPRVIQTAPRPDYFFLWLYAVLSLLPPQLETPALLIGPAIALIVLLALRFVSGEGEKSWKRRPIAVLMILLVAVGLGTFTNMADHAPWSPVMDASTGAAIPPRNSRADAHRFRFGVRSFSSRSNVTTATRSAISAGSAGRRLMRSRFV